MGNHLCNREHVAVVLFEQVPAVRTTSRFLLKPTSACSNRISGGSEDNTPALINESTKEAEGGSENAIKNRIQVWSCALSIGVFNPRLI